MAEQTNGGPPRSFWIISGVALVWNILGVLAYIGQVTMGPEGIAALPPEQQPLYENIPAWATGAFAIAVFGGVLGCVALLLRKKVATTLFIASLAGVIVQFLHNFLMTDILSIMGPAVLIGPLFVFGIAIYLIMFSKKSEANGYLQ